MPDIKEHINYKKLQFLIKKLELEFPVADLTRLTGYTDGTISQYYTGKVKPSTKFLQTVIEKGGVDISEFESEATQEKKDDVDTWIDKIVNHPRFNEILVGRVALVMELEEKIKRQKKEILGKKDKTK